MKPRQPDHSSTAATTYPRTSIVLHWLGALLVAGCFALGLVMTDIPGLTPTKLKYFSWHKWIGLTVLLTLLPRVLWRLLHASPAMPAGMARWQQRAAHLTHLALYALLVAVPVSGLLFSQAAGVPVVLFGVLPIPAIVAPDAQLKVLLRSLHWIFNYSLLCLVCLHLLAVIKHQFINRDGLLARMLPFLQRPPSSR